MLPARPASLCFLLLAAACGGDLQNQQSAPAALQSPPVPQAPVAQEPAALTVEGPGAEASLLLPPLSAAEESPSEENGRRRIGAHRKLPDPLPGAWTVGEHGARVWRLDLRSMGAVALRLHFTNFHVEEGVVLLLQPLPEGAAEKERRHQGDGPAGDGEFWSDLIEGDRVVVEYRPASSSPTSDALPFRIEEISHLWASPLDAF